MQSPSIKFQIPKKEKPPFNLEERLARFGENTIQFCKTAKKNEITRPLIGQLIRSATSIGANYYEAINASSRKDFRYKIYIAKKECEETKYWLRMVKTATPEKAPELRVLWLEAHELVLILQTIVNKVNQ